MIDLHIHLLHGIDDGATDLQEAVKMCRLAAASGCEHLVATPHQRHQSWWNTDPAAMEALRREIQDNVGLRPKLHLGAEIKTDSQLLSELERGPDSGILSLAGSRYLLLETDPYGLGPEPEWLTHELRLAGWLPIFAHPELSPGLCDDLNLLARLKDAGALLQVTAMSVTGGFGSTAQRRVRRMLDRGLVHFVASDAHGSARRPPGLAEAHAHIASRWGDELARRLTLTNPQAVLDDLLLPA